MNQSTNQLLYAYKSWLVDYKPEYMKVHVFAYNFVYLEKLAWSCIYQVIKSQYRDRFMHEPILIVSLWPQASIWYFTEPDLILIAASHPMAPV